MANKKISQLTPGTALVGTEPIPTVQGGVTVSTTPNAIGDLIKPYKVYTALLTQSGTDAPVVTIVSNTLDLTITWVRNNIGQYYAGDITSNIPDAKTVYIVSDASNGINLYGVPLKQVHLWTFGNNVPQTGRFLNLSVTTVNNSGDITFADWDSPKVILIEIRVYN